MKKDYEALSMKVVTFKEEDVVRTSGGGFTVEEQLFSTNVYDPNN